MLKEFSGDFRVYRVVMASDNPIDTLSSLRKGEISIISFLDMLEMLDVQETLREEANKRVAKDRKQKR